MKFSGIKDTYTVIQPSPLSISKTFLSLETEILFLLNNVSSFFSPSPQLKPLVFSILLFVSENLLILSRSLIKIKTYKLVLLCLAYFMYHNASRVQKLHSFPLLTNISLRCYIKFYLSVCVYHFVYSSVDRHLCCLHLWATVYNAAMNTGI